LETILPQQKSALQVFQQDLFDSSRWPKKPYCTDHLESGIFPRSLASAIKKKYIQANPPHLRVWSIFDLDYQGAALSWESANLPPPSWATINRDNGHAHLVYGLRAPVLVASIEARQGPIRYLNAVEAAFRAKLNGDSGYSGLITKNPAHPLWKLLKGPADYYDLSDLAEYVDLTKFKAKTGAKVLEIGLGRNVTLFDFLRYWAYASVRKYKGAGLSGWNAFMSDTNNKALERNCDFPTPMDPREVWHVAKSVARWTYNNFDVQASDSRFSALQAERGKRSGKARLLASEDKRVTARLMRASGSSFQHIADTLDVHVNTVSLWFKTTHNEP
jgi:Replicase family/Primase C terminal 1 (PriCT-1)